MVIAYANLTGNWRLEKVKGNLVLDGVKLIRGMRAMLFFPGPVMIFDVMQCGYMFSTINLVPLHKPLCISIVRSNIMGAPILRLST